MQTTQDFLETIICKAGETIQPLGSNEWQIQKWTARTFKTLGIVLASQEYDVHPPESLVKLKLTPHARRSKLPISEELKQEALQKGWLVQEIKFKSDGRTPERSVYRMGPGLYAYEQSKKRGISEADAALRQSAADELDHVQSILPAGLLFHIKEYLESQEDVEGWGQERVRKFTEFLVAYLRLRTQQSQMEFKEIGATYYQRIGGSKVFDSYREEFIGRLEKWTGAPVHEIGIVSTGSIVPLFFTGDVQGTYSNYLIGTVHATTEIAVTDEQFETSANVLWLVENRAVLTRMAKEPGFTKDTASLIVGVDGQVRGAHRQFIRQLCLSSSIRQVMIWVDYDAAGKIIARDLMNLADGIPVRFIGTEGKIFTEYTAYIEWMETIPAAEQEMTLGGPAEWRTWINQ